MFSISSFSQLTLDDESGHWLFGIYLETDIFFKSIVMLCVYSPKFIQVHLSLSFSLYVGGVQSYVITSSSSFSTPTLF